MSNPVVMITGALTGIGRATALDFAKEGATVVVSGGREAVREIREPAVATSSLRN
jgi:NAD(P)-dependent dehydrogenase (short-subunit alcohol dehydrogenase family)